MNLIWTPHALQDRFEVWEIIAADHLEAAVDLDQRFSDAARLLVSQPSLGRKGRLNGTREWVVHANYRLIYEVTDEALFVLAVVHSRRNWPS